MKKKITIIFLLLRITAYAQQHSLILQPDPVCGKDALLHGLITERAVNYGANAQFMANAWTYGGTPGRVRSVVEFDLHSIPPGAVIDSAFLSLYAWGLPTGSGPHSTLSGSNEAWLRRVTSPWNENTVTWNTSPASTTVDQVAVPASVSPTEDYWIAVTPLVQDMIDDPMGSFGFLFLLQNEAYYRRLNFCSSDNTNPALRPKLEVYYTSPVSGAYSPVNLGNDTSMCFLIDSSLSLLLNANLSGGTYLWQDGSALSTFHVSQPGDYWVKVSTCSDVFNDTIHVSGIWCDTIPAPIPEPVPEEIILQLPNVFTPDQDNKNAFFIPVESKGIVLMSTLIYNRWGQELFKTDNLMIKWDGITNGKKASEGTYFWIINYTDKNNKKATLKGNVLLLR